MKIAKFLACAALFSARSSFSMNISSIFPTGSAADQQIKQAALAVGSIALGAGYAYFRFEVWPKISSNCSKKN